MSNEIDYQALVLSKQYTLEAQSLNASVGPLVLSTSGLRADSYPTADLAIRSIYNQFVSGLTVQDGLLVNVEPDSTTDVEPYINDLLSIYQWWDLKSDILLKIKDATRNWLKWSESIQTFFTTGIVNIVGSSGAVTEIPFVDDTPSSGVSTIYQGQSSDEGTIYSTKASNLSEYFSQVMAYNAYGRITAQTGQSLDIVKNQKARAALNELEDILTAAENNVAGANSALTDISTRLRQANEIAARALETISSVRLGV